MPKTKGTPGGRVVQIIDEEEYQHLVEFLQYKWVMPSDWTQKMKRAFKSKVKQFGVVDDGNENQWPDCPRLHLIKRAPNQTVVSSKLFVPKWHHKKVLDEFHGGGAIGGHYGRNKLYKLVSLRSCTVFTFFQGQFNSRWYI
jgi:hypothetical protein